MTQRRIPGVALVAVLILFVNDHILKPLWPGFLTGKLSDVAGMIFFPVILHAALWLVVPRGRRNDAAHDRLLFIACIATALVFTLTKTNGSANEAYRVTWGALQWPLRAARALAHGAPIPAVGRVVLVADPSDVLAVPFVVIAYLSGRVARAQKKKGPRVSPRSLPQWPTSGSTCH